jgi:hypothetical protein
METTMNVCAAIAMIFLTGVVVTFCFAAMVFMVRVIFDGD